MAKMRGIKITSNWKTNEAGQIMVNIKVSAWYMPVLLIKGLKAHHIPFRLWPIAFYKYYSGKVKR